MRMRMQNTNNAAVTSSVRVYEGYGEALLLMTSEDRQISDALKKIFSLNGALLVDPQQSLPWDEPDFGDCKIGEGSVLITLEGSGGSFMGMRCEVPWGRTDPEWRRLAELRERVWLGLIGPGDYARISAGGWAEEIPQMRVLKLEVSP